MHTRQPFIRKSVKASHAASAAVVADGAWATALASERPAKAAARLDNARGDGVNINKRLLSRDGLAAGAGNAGLWLARSKSMICTRICYTSAASAD